MSHARGLCLFGALAVSAAMGSAGAKAQEIKTVFVIAMENHNWTQPANQFTGEIQQVFQNPNAPFINSLVNGSAFALVNAVYWDRNGLALCGIPYSSRLQLKSDDERRKLIRRAVVLTHGALLISSKRSQELGRDKR